jgi:hypothetical protein
MLTTDGRRWRSLRAKLAAASVVDAAQSEAERVLQSWSNLADLDILRSLLVQVAVIGNARGGYRFGQLLREQGCLEGLLADPTHQAARLHALARRGGVRFVGADASAPKITAWCRILSHPAFVSDGVLRVRERIQSIIADRSPDDARANRQVREQVIAMQIPMIGRKSWSDWLNNRGLTQHLLAIDTRVVGVWKRELHANIRLEDFQDADRYAAWEDACDQHLARPLGITLSELDKRLFMLPVVDRPRRES